MINLLHRQDSIKSSSILSKISLTSKAQDPIPQWSKKGIINPCHEKLGAL